MPLDPETIANLRAVLDPRHERLDFAHTMERWASEVTEACDGEAALSLDDAALVGEILEPKPGKQRPGRMRDSRAGRPRADKERYAALLLAVIYSEYSGKPPTRIVKPLERDQAQREYSSRFYKFAGGAFDLIGLKPRPQAFREAWERWERSRDFSKDAMRILLWGGLPGFRRRGKLRSKSPN